MNNIFDNLINRIGRTIVEGARDVSNPFERWNGPVMDFGDTIQSIKINYINGYKPDFDPAEPNPFKTVKEKPFVQYAQYDDAMQYKNTVFANQLQMAFTAPSTFGSFTSALIDSIYRSNGLDKYVKWKKYLSQTSYVADGAIDSVSYDSSNEEQYAIDILMKIKQYVSNKLRFPSSDYNKAGIVTSSPSVDVIMKMETRNLIDKYLSGVYNVDKLDIPGANFIYIDDFATVDGKTDPLDVVMLTSGMAKYTPRTPQAGALYNPEGLYSNYWLTIQGIYSFDLYENAVQIYRTNA